MRNCIASYGEELSSKAARLFKLSEGDRSIAIFEVRPLGPDREAHITQLKGPGNSECARTVWGAAQRWLDSHGDLRCPTQSWHVRAARRRRTHDLLAPYAHAVPGAGLDPTDATTLSRLQMTLVSLARETGSTGAFRSPLRRLLG